MDQAIEAISKLELPTAELPSQKHFDADIVDDLFKNLYSALDKANFDRAEMMISKLSEYVEPGLFSEVTRQLDNYEFRSASSLLKKVQKHVERLFKNLNNGHGPTWHISCQAQPLVRSIHEKPYPCCSSRIFIRGTSLLYPLQTVLKSGGRRWVQFSKNFFMGCPFRAIPPSILTITLIRILALPGQVLIIPVPICFLPQKK